MNKENGPAYIDSLSGLERAALVIRHADRHPVHTVTDSLGVGLTEKGFRDAYDLGAMLPTYVRVNFFHSPALRCEQTAREIANAVRENGGKVGEFAMEAALCSPYVRDEKCLMEADRVGDVFMRRWFEGRIDHSWIDDTDASSLMVLRPIIKRMIEGPSHLDVHVSHDWDIMLLREKILGMKHEDHGWLGYLDGLVFYPNGEGHEVRFRDRSAVFIINDKGIMIKAMR